ncbi:RecA-superfamily ATPase implicated in signal transduction-like protein [Haloterrigena turkmenica DSM 5511]|uniref:RecA-superfamily ATPase implicated in signal transduction-like protein n=1 Tax=Haloterrigena turkmenica (strain ATCC 51198 / DSM 5511 / JCM 9101 / NCIMB 13204 / VKM B-1734 / 4k) TaxID=543526 RepID=D2RZL9_HALTV|nr:ATPase domain-containing protein [Haloterrigena turkmenica]ADB62058.1 RecA-superfamily ATPase implicated in signal transduction-like protein [Haloterrigena turkmenica DSM 5511]
MTSQQRPERSPEYPLECDHCHYPIPSEPEETDDGQFCSTACLEASEDDEDEMPDPSAYKRIVTGVEPLDSLIPNGVPADSFVCLSGTAGTRRSELLTELVWRAIERGEPAVLVTATTPPAAVLERFFENGWNVLPALEDDRLRLVDCFTHRLADRDAFRDHRGEWIEFVGEAAADSIVPIEEPTDVEPILRECNAALDDLEMTETGLVAIDSLSELGRGLETDHVHEFVTETRATVCKARYVPIFGGWTAGDEGVAMDESIFDGVVDLRLADHLEPDTRLRQLGVRKLTGARYLPQWITYEYEPVRGLVASVVESAGQATPGGPPSREMQGVRERR